MNPLNASARGVYLITVTPFTQEGVLDLASTDRMSISALSTALAA